MSNDKTAPAGELTYEQIKELWLLVGSAHEWRELASTIKHICRAAIAADRALRSTTPALESVERRGDASLPERTSQPAALQGLFRKFEVQRTDGNDNPGGKHHGCDYFVIDVTHDQHARAALSAYAKAAALTHPTLALDMTHRYGLQTEAPTLADAQAALAAKDAAHEKQLNACKSLIASLERQRTTLREGSAKWAEAVKSLLSEREANAILTSEIATLTAERDHWEANHDAQVQRARLLVERQDIPVERVKAYEQVATLTLERDALLAGGKCSAAVIEAAQEWASERTPKDWAEGDLMKAVATMNGDWAGCPGCDHQCDEPCMPATVAEIHASIDAAMTKEPK